MDYLLGLPDMVARKLLTEWLHFCDVTRTDTAYCNVVKRPVFHELAFSSLSVYPFASVQKGYVDNEYTQHEFVEWLVLRNVRVGAWELPSVDPNLSLEVVKRAGDALLFVVISGSMLEQEDVERWLILIGDHCCNVTDLALAKCAVSDDCVRTLFSKCSRISKLCVTGNVSKLPSNTLCMLKLESLATAFTQMGDLEFAELMQQCPNLTALALINCPNISDVGFLAVAQYCPLLDNLHLARVDHVSSEALGRLVTQCKQLTSVAVSCALGNETVFALAQHCTRLTRLCCDAKDTITDEAVVALTQGCAHLEELCILSAHITDTALYALAWRCKQLQHLRLESSTAISDDGLLAVYYNCPKLRSICINVDSCPEVCEISLCVMGHLVVKRPLHYLTG